jgi:hypothetical protein
MKQGEMDMGRRILLCTGFSVLLNSVIAVLPVTASADPDDTQSLSKIANGVSTFEPPSVVALISSTNGLPICSGTLIGCETVLTAAHCVCSGTGQECQQGGPGRRSAASVAVAMQHGPVKQVRAIHVAPDYVFGQAADLAILELSDPVTGIAPARINTVRKPEFGTSGAIVGFGISRPGSNDSGVKRRGRIVTDACPQLSQITLPDAGHVCWTFNSPDSTPGSASNTCGGDSGGPLFIDFGEGEMVAGVTSGGTGDCHLDDRSWDTDVFVNRSWIQETAADDIDNASCGALPVVGPDDVTVIGRSGRIDIDNSEKRHSFNVPADTQLLRVVLNGEQALVANDFDLYVRAGQAPTVADYDCRPYIAGNFEACEFTDPAAGIWHVLVRRFAGSGGEYQLTSTLFAGNTEPTRMLNISTNGFVDERGMIAGFIVAGEQAKRFVIMGENAGSLDDPVLRLSNFDSGALIAQNDNWRSHASADEVKNRLRAPGSERDAAFAVTLAPGAYLAQLNGKNTTTGNGIVSVTELRDDKNPTRMLNISTNGFVGEHGMIAGFIVTGVQPKRFVIMGENAGTLQDPVLELTPIAAATVLAKNDNWQDHPSADEVVAELRAPGAERDAAFAIELQPGVYLARLSGRNGTSGAGIVSVTEIARP